MTVTKEQYTYAVGRRKEATAVIKLFPNWKWTFTIVKEGQNQDLKKYFGEKFLVDDALYAFSILGYDVLKSFNAEIVVRWWWIRWQAEAIRLWFARALIEYNMEYKTTLKPYWLLKRDPRAKERKKPWLRGARRRPQWSKR